MPRNVQVFVIDDDEAVALLKDQIRREFESVPDPPE